MNKYILVIADDTSTTTTTQSSNQVEELEVLNVNENK